MPIDLLLNNADLKVGGADTSKFVANINSHRWNDEAFLNINYTSMVGATQSLVNGVSILEKGNEQFKTWQLGEDILETAIVFASKPASNDIRFKLTHSPELQFNPQGLVYDPLLQGEIEGESRIIPANVEGSFAVYLPKSNNQYQTGKFAHLYRWEVIDANGIKAWCDPLALDGTDLVITMPGAFLDTAAYPLIAMGAGDTFGYTTAGSSVKEFGTSTNCEGSIFDTHTATTGDTITTFHAHSSWAFTDPSTLGVAVYSGATEGSTMDSGSRLAAVASMDMASEYPTFDWNTVTVSQGLTNAVEYAIAMEGLTGTCEVHYDGTGGSQGSSTNSGGALPTTWSESGTSTRKYSLYATFTTGGGGTIRRNPFTGPFARPFSGPFG